MEQTPCPVVERGLELRDYCSECDGEPPCGQQRLRRRDTLCLEGGPADTMFAVIEGFVREMTTDEQGRIQAIRLAGPGELVGAEALVRPHYVTTVEALTPARACRMPVESLQERLAKRPDQAHAMVLALSDQTVSQRSFTKLLGPLSAEERVLTMLRRLTSSAPTGAWVRLPLTRQDLGELLGLAQATVSRVIHRLARRGLIDVRSRLVRVAPAPDASIEQAAGQGGRAA